MEIRPPEAPADARAVARTHDRAWATAYRGLLPDEFLAGFAGEPSPGQVREWTDRFRDDRNRFLVADDGGVVGYANVRLGEDAKPFVGPDEAGLEEIYVDPDAWGRGVGTALLEAALDRLPGEVGALRLEMLAGNDLGRRFYEARGFERTGTGEIEISGEDYETAIYSLEL